MEIQLIIRAPNQNFEDQVIDCSGDWTVLRLKEHLSQVYPNKPIIQDQKLIYSGHVLQDNLQLKDVVRTGDVDSNVHIFHLVYKDKSPVLKVQQAPKSSQGLAQQPIAAEPACSVFPAGNTAQPTPESSFPRIDNYPMMPYSFPSLYSDPEMFSRMIAMQQMYTQSMIQYWQSVSSALNTNAARAITLSPQPTPQSSTNTAALAPAPEQGNPRVNARDDDAANFDWFEFLLHHCRFLVLIGIMYFYSSPERFFIVISFLVFTALYREGWLFRDGIGELFNRFQNWVNQDAVNVPENNEENQAQPINEEDHYGEELEAAMDGENPPHVQNPDIVNNNNQQNSFFSIIAAFFFSLVPEAPPPVNIN